MEKILTVIIPTYNMEHYLNRCVNSIVVPQMETLEVIIINDGSIDRSSAIAHEFESSFPNSIYVIDKNNGNYGSCINVGLKVATGKYIKILDADDKMETRNFSSFLQYLSVIDSDLIISDFSIIDEQGKIKETCTFSLPKKCNSSLGTLTSIDIKWLWHHAITYRRSILESIGYSQTEGISYTDDEWIFKPMVKVKSVSYFSKNLYLYLRGRVGQTFDPLVLKKIFGQRLIVMKTLLIYFEEVKHSVNQEQYWYLSQKLRTRLESIYHFYLIENHNRASNQLIIDFDQTVLQLSKDAFLMMNDVKDLKLRSHYISNWRDANYNYKLPVFYVLYAKFKIGQFLKNL